VRREQELDGEVQQRAETLGDLLASSALGQPSFVDRGPLAASSASDETFSSHGPVGLQSGLARASVRGPAEAAARYGFFSPVRATRFWYERHIIESMK
jgi:hypothetical protein